MKKKAALEEEKTLLNEKLRSQQQVGITEKPPYALSFYDSILDELAAAEQQKESANLHFDEIDLKNQIKSIEDSRSELEKRVQELIQGQQAAEEAWFQAQKPATDIAGKQPDTIAEAALKEREAWLKTYQEVLEQTENVLGFLGQREQIWRLRYALVKDGIQRKELLGKREEIDNHIKNLNNVLNIQQRYQINLRAQIASLEKKISETDLDPKIGVHLKNQLGALQKLAERRFE